MAKNTKNISMSVKPAHHALLKARADKLNIPMSEIGRRLFEDFVELSPDVHKKLRYAAERKEISVSALVEQLAERYPIDDESVKPILLKIPLTILGNKDTLKKWLNEKVEALVSHLYPQQ
jgi:hypothetical protein